MTADEIQIYRRIICEQINLQDLQGQNSAPNHDPLGVTRRIKQQRRLLAQLWQTADSLKKLKPLA
jgi:hypothetical protein